MDQLNNTKHETMADVKSEADGELQHVTFDDKETARILRKVDVRLIPILSVLYLMSYLDRGNMGNAALIGLKADLGLSAWQYNMCLTIFFIPYALLEVPSNIVLKFLRPSIWIPIMMFAWGLVMTLMGIVKNYGGLLTARCFLAVAEAGFFPAATYLLTHWYCRHEYQSRMSIFYAAGALSGAFSGLLAYLIEKMDGIAGLEGWRWLFILEGLLTVVIGLIMPWLLPDSPSTARFLTHDEKLHLEARLRADTGHWASSYDVNQKFKRSHVWAAIKDWKIWLGIIVYWGNAIPIYGFIYTLPTVINELGYETSIAQLMTIPIYFAAMSSLVIVAFISDRMKRRAPFIIYPLILGGIGLVCLIAVPKGKTPGAIYFLLFVVAIGLYTELTGVIAWTANNLAGPWKRAVGMAMVISIGNLGGAVGTNIYLAREAPHYWTGFGVSLGVVVAATVAAWVMKVKLERINAERDAMSEEEIRAKYTEEELADLGDESPFFRYTN